MSVTLTLGWWLAPVLIALASVTWALWDRPSERGGFIPSPAPLFRLAAAVIVSLIAWVIYLSIRLVLA